jgi:hypothetical protein
MYDVPGYSTLLEPLLRRTLVPHNKTEHAVALRKKRWYVRFAVQLMYAYAVMKTAFRFMHRTLTRLPEPLTFHVSRFTNKSESVP